MQIFQVDAFTDTVFGGNPAAVVPLTEWTLATAHVLFSEKGYDKDLVVFHTKSGALTVKKTATGYEMNFPADTIVPVDNPPQALLDGLGVDVLALVTAKGNEVDFVSRCFFPQAGVDEDPTTGSAHTSLTPYWAEKFGKDTLQARQLSKRIGNLECVASGDRVLLRGNAVTYLIGEIKV